MEKDGIYFQKLERALKKILKKEKNFKKNTIIRRKNDGFIG